MSQRFLRFLLWFSVIMIAISKINKSHQDFSLLIDFTCATAKDELEKHPEMRTIAMVELELENNFPSEFSREVLKCLPENVAKVIINPHTHQQSTMILPKETFVIYVADEIKLSDSFHKFLDPFMENFAVVNHLSKHLILSSDGTKPEGKQWIFTKLLNVVQIYEKNQKVIARSFDMTRNLPTFETFESSQRENRSQILFPDKTKNLNGQTLYVAFVYTMDVLTEVTGNPDGSRTYNPFHKWRFFLDIIAERSNATLKFPFIQGIAGSQEEHRKNQDVKMIELAQAGKLDFHLNFLHETKKRGLESYNDQDWCFLAPFPDPISITDQILFLPMDMSCWMWLGITIAVSTLIWRISEGHWGFAFGFFSYFMGQGQLIIRIRTNRLTMKILLQLLIFAIFIFSNGYQSIVTSFMLNPVEEKLLKTIDEVFESNLKFVSAERIILFAKEHPKYQNSVGPDRLIDMKFVRRSWARQMIEKKMVFLQPCKALKRRIDIEGDGRIWNGIYQVPGVVLSRPYDLYTRPFHPYLDSFQELMDRTFEAGLHQAWERFFYFIWKEHTDERAKAEEQKVILEFEDIIPFFLILAFGFGAALLAFYCEIFWKDFVTQLTKDYIKNKLQEIFGTEIRRGNVARARRRRRTRVRHQRTRRNQVEPI